MLSYFYILRASKDLLKELLCLSFFMIYFTFIFSSNKRTLFTYFSAKSSFPISSNFPKISLYTGLVESINYIKFTNIRKLYIK